MEPAMIQTPWEEVMDRGEGSLTSSAEKIFAAHINVKVFNTESAILDMHLLLIPISMIFDITLALVRGIFQKSRFQSDVADGRHAAVDAVCGCGERGGNLGRDWLGWQICRGECALGRTLGGMRTIGRHIGCRIENVEIVQVRGGGGWADKDVVSCCLSGAGRGRELDETRSERAKFVRN